MMIPDQNIDPLFNDLKDLEVAPSKKVWEGIEGHLDKKKKRLIPLYWPIGAAASVLVVIGLFLFNSPESEKSESEIARLEQYQESKQATSSRASRQQKGEEARQKSELNQYSKNNENSTLIANTSEKKTAEKPAQTNELDSKERVYRKLPFSEEKRSETIAASDKMMAHTYDADAWKVNVPDAQRLAYSNKLSTAMFESKSEMMVDEIDDSNFSPRFVLGGEYSPTYAFRETSGSVSRNSESGINKAGGGISLAVKVNSRWQIETGVKYAMLGQEVSASSRSDRVYSFASAAPSSENSMDITEVNLSNSLGSVTPSVSPSRMQDVAGFQSSSNELVDLRNSDFATYGNPLLEQNLGYLQVPLTIRYQLLKQSRLNLSFSGGISTNWLVDNDAYLQMEGDKKRIGQTQGLSDMGLSTHAGVAVSLPVFKGIHLRMEPRIDYFLSDISKDAPGSFRPYSFGVFTGLFYEW